MDSNIVHLIVSGLLTVLFGGLGWLVKGFTNRVSVLEKDLVDHKLYDAAEFAKLNASSNELMRRLDKMDEKLDRLLEK